MLSTAARFWNGLCSMFLDPPLWDGSAIIISAEPTMATYVGRPLDRLIVADQRLVAQDPAGLADIVPSCRTGELDPVAGKERVFAGDPAHDFRNEPDEQAYNPGHGDHVPRRHRLDTRLRQMRPEFVRKVPERNWVPVCDEEDLAGRPRCRAELVCSQQVGINEIVDVRPVIEVLVIPDLNVRLLGLVGCNEAL
jgi:hypothetical protein